MIYVKQNHNKCNGPVLPGILLGFRDTVAVGILIIEPVGEVMAEEEAVPPVLGIVDKVDEQAAVAVHIIITGSHPCFVRDTSWLTMQYYPAPQAN